MSSFLGGRSHGAFGQPAFFLAGNRMSTMAFEKEFDRIEVKNLRKNSQNL